MSTPLFEGPTFPEEVSVGQDTGKVLIVVAIRTSLRVRP